jgi:hypothetical protein
MCELLQTKLTNFALAVNNRIIKFRKLKTNFVHRLTQSQYTIKMFLTETENFLQEAAVELMS